MLVGQQKLSPMQKYLYLSYARRVETLPSYRENYHSSWIDYYRILNIVSRLLDSEDGKRFTLIPQQF